MMAASLQGDAMPLRPGFDAERFNRFGADFLPGYLGLSITRVSEGLIEGELELRKALLAPNTYLHAGTVVTFADTLAGYGCVAHLPENAQNFTTIELKTNFLNTAREGRLYGEARAVHLGRSTHIWDTVVTHGAERRQLALFRCTQLILYPR
jgi:1,4-dihydroxy-2-naphthoyl-CoA hydrolase